MDRKDDWYESTHSLRKLLYELPVGNRREARATITSPYHYKFGNTYCDRTRTWFVYNLKTDNIIATVKRGNGRAIIRYRENSVYSDILGRYKYDCPTVHVKSPNLRRRVSWVRDRVKSGLREHYRRVRESFLAEGISPSSGQPHTMVLPLLTTTQAEYTGRMGAELVSVSDGLSETRVVFDSAPTRQLQENTVTMMQYLSRNLDLVEEARLEIPEEMTYEYLVGLHHRTQEMGERFEEARRGYEATIPDTAAAAGVSHSSWRTSAMERAMMNATEPSRTPNTVEAPEGVAWSGPETSSIQEDMNRLVRERIDRMSREMYRSPAGQLYDEWVINDSEGSDDV